MERFERHEEHRSWEERFLDRLNEIDRKLGLLIRGVRHLDIEEHHEMADLTALKAAVENEVTVDGSIETLITNLVAEIRAAGTDQAALDGLTAQLEAEAATLKDVVTANTAPVNAPAPEPTPAETPATPDQPA